MSLETITTYTESFSNIKTEDELYSVLLELARQIKTDGTIRSKQHFIYGCQANAWLNATKKDGVWIFSFDSESALIKGVGKIVIDTFNGLSTENILKIKFHNFKSLAAKLNFERQKSLQILINQIHTLVNQGDTQ